MKYPILVYVCTAALFVPPIVGVFRFRRLSGSMKLMAALTIFACIELGFEYLVPYLKHPNIFVSDYYEFIEFCTLWAVFSMSVQNRRTRIILGTRGTGFALYWLLHIPSPESQDVISGTTPVVSRVVLVAMTLVTIHALVALGTKRVIEAPIFWVAFGVLLYSAGTLMVMGLGNQILRLGKPYFDAAWQINWLMNIVANMFYTKAFLCKQQL